MMNRTLSALAALLLAVSGSACMVSVGAAARATSSTEVTLTGTVYTSTGDPWALKIAQMCFDLNGVFGSHRHGCIPIATNADGEFAVTRNADEITAGDTTLYAGTIALVVRGKAIEPSSMSYGMESRTVNNASWERYNLQGNFVIPEELARKDDVRDPNELKDAIALLSGRAHTTPKGSSLIEKQLPSESTAGTATGAASSASGANL